MMRFLFLSLLAACGSETIVHVSAEDAGAPITPTEPDASTPVDAGAPAVFPAPHPSPRLLTKLPGPVLAKPVLIPVFYGDDPDRAATEATLAQIPGSAWWKNVEEYGVGELTIGKSVVLAASAPATYALTNIQDTVMSTWTQHGAPTPNGTQIYMMIFPTKTKVLQSENGEEFCLAGGGYHDSQSTDFAYAVVPHCSGRFDDFMITATHELIEAATDPYPLVNPAWAGTDDAHIGLRMEVGDLCDYGGSKKEGGIGLFGTRVEAIHSNKRAQANLDPCAPDRGLAYFGAAPEVDEDVTANDFVIGDVKGKGISLAVGEKKTVKLHLFSAEGVGSFGVSARGIDPMTLAKSDALDVKLSAGSGENGDVLEVTVKRTSASSGDAVFISTTSSNAVFWDSFFVESR